MSASDGPGKQSTTASGRAARCPGVWCRGVCKAEKGGSAGEHQRISEEMSSGDRCVPREVDNKGS